MAALLLGFIGDSITVGFGLTGTPPPELMCAALSTAGQTVTAVNEGVNGAATADWVLTGDGKPLTNAINAFTGQGVTTVFIMLGTNDSKFAGVSPSQYQANLQQIIDTLKANGITKIVLNQPPAMQPSGTGFPDPSSENNLLNEYRTSLANLAVNDPRHVWLGDQTAFVVFGHNAAYFQADGIHPNDAGAAVLAQLWASAYLNPQEVVMANDPIIQPSTGGGGTATPTAGSVVPASISTTATDDFVFPRDVTTGRNWIGPNGMKIIPLANGTNAFAICQADGTAWAYFDTTNRRLGLLTNSPNQPLTVNGNARIDGQLAMGSSSPSAACLIDMVNPFVGCGIPAMTSAQKTAISPNRAGNLVYDTDLGKVCVNTGAAWQTITST